MPRYRISIEYVDYKTFIVEANSSSLEDIKEAVETAHAYGLIPLCDDDPNIVINGFERIIEEDQEEVK